MAARNGALFTLVDVTASFGEAGTTQGAVAEILEKDNPILEDMSWKEGNLLTGERTMIRTSLPGVAWRRYNQGVPKSKGTVGAFDDAAAQLAAASQIDRDLAILGGNPAKARSDHAKPFFQSMNNEFAETLFYGNALAESKEFTGIFPRYNDLDGPNGDQIIDAGGTGTDNRSIVIVNWGVDGVTGIYPKGSKAGLIHMDTTGNKAMAEDGYPIGDLVQDESGNEYLAYTDYWKWDCGLSVKDPRNIVRIANIDYSLLTKDRTTGADIEDLIIQAFHRLNNPSGNAAIYMPKPLGAIMHRQALNDSRGGRGITGFEEIAGRKVPTVLGLPIRSVDALNVDEARVTA